LLAFFIFLYLFYTTIYICVCLRTREIIKVGWANSLPFQIGVQFEGVES